jgi:hypothetical protein
MLQRRPFHIFHSDERTAIGLANFVNGADVGMIQRGCGAGFAAKTFECLRVVGHVARQKFQRDESAEVGVLSLVDNAHSPAAKFLDDAVM